MLLKIEFEIWLMRLWNIMMWCYEQQEAFENFSPHWVTWSVIVKIYTRNDMFNGLKDWRRNCNLRYQLEVLNVDSGEQQVPELVSVGSTSREQWNTWLKIPAAECRCVLILILPPFLPVIPKWSPEAHSSTCWRAFGFIHVPLWFLFSFANSHVLSAWHRVCAY